MIKMYGVAQRDTIQSLTCAAPVGSVIPQKLPLCEEKIFSRQPCF